MSCFQRGHQMRLTRFLLQQFRNHVFLERLKYYERFRPQPISLQMYLGFGQEIDSLLQNLPQLPSTTEIHRLYCQSFEDLLPFENSEPTNDNITSFNEKLETVMLRHENFIENMAEVFNQLRQKYGINITSNNKIQYFLDRLYFKAISIRIMQHQHLIIFGTILPESPRHIGCIDPACDVSAVILDAYESARFICDGCYCDSPKLQFDSYNSLTPGLPIAVAAIPSHLYQIMFELFKNSMRATIDRYGEFEKLPPIQVLATLGQEDLSIRVSDSGVGIPRKIIDQLFRYGYTTAPPPETGGHNAALAGYGYGLPLSRLYARYFRGDLIIISMEGHGTDAYLYIKAVPFKTCETIPRYSTSSRNTPSSSTVSQPVC
ncbi:[Pyruvate dehydrogenase [lipoamide]] kinase, mitochondrial [Dirofilaria immitis]|nr:[Pyruvate dehydrogenase [lipoamide]] kinase, mitochondrial [Dirofilaria immitis]